MSALSAAAHADPDCKCRYAGQFYKTGEYACIKTSKGFRLALCSLSENVSSWRFLEKGCRGLSLAPQAPDVVQMALNGRKDLRDAAPKQSRRP